MIIHMTETQSFTLLHASSQSSARVADLPQPAPTPTIFRDTAFADAPFTTPGLYATDDSDQITPLLHLGLAALLLPTFAYTVSALVSMTANGTLEKAVRALLP